MKRIGKMLIMAVMPFAMLISWENVEAGQFIAFSMKEAQRRLSNPESVGEDVLGMGGIKRIAGLVYDQANDDFIVLGQANGNGNSLRLDDLVVALRSRLVYKEWPEVSIDRTEDSKTTELQAVNFKGGIENTQFGYDLLEADIFLKRVAMGYASLDVWGIHSYFAMAVDHAKETGSERSIQTRFWFYPTQKRSVAVRDGIVAIREFNIGTQAQVVGSVNRDESASGINGIRNEIGERFAESITANFDDLRAYYPVLDRIETLLRMVALAYGIEAMPDKPNLDYWLSDYEINWKETPEGYPLLKKSEDIEIEGRKGVFFVDGGVKLSVLLSELKEDGDVTALRDIVIKTRPNENCLIWRVSLDGWNMPGYSGNEYEIEANDADRSVSEQILPGCSIGERFIPIGKTGLSQQPMMNFSSSPLLSNGMPSFNFANRMTPQRYSPDVGGVMLQNPAKISGNLTNHGAVEITDGNFSLIVEGEGAQVDPNVYRKFITALWSVYYSDEDPGISIDPIAPGVDKHMVRYIGKVVNNDLGRVMREADYLMKKWAVGTERPDIPGFRNPDDIAADNGMVYVGAPSRFWFVPQGMKFKRGGDMLLFEDGWMTVQTEYLYKGDGMRADPANEEFARYFTENYDMIAEYYPIYRELFEYAKLVSLAKYLKESGIPLYWFLMANKDLVITEDSPGTVDAMAKGSDYFKGVHIEGGVDIWEQGQYVFDEEAAEAIQEVLSRRSKSDNAVEEVSRPVNRQVAQTHPISFRLDEEDYTVLPNYSLTSGTDRRGIHYQTDIALRNGSEPGLELVRFYNPDLETPGEFGEGWHLLIPYQIDPVGDAERKFLNVIIPEKMAVINRITGEREILTFSTDRYQIAGYVPDQIESSQVVGLFLMSDASFRLADKLGNEFWFNPGGYLTDMIFSERHQVHVEYQDNFTDSFEEAPYVIRPADEEMIDFQHIPLPGRMAVEDRVNGEAETLRFSDQGQIVGYVPEDDQNSRFGTLALMTDGSFRLLDTWGNEFAFAPDGGFEGVFPSAETAVVKSISSGNRKIRFRYGLARSGVMRITSSYLIISNGSKEEKCYAVNYKYDEDGNLSRVEKFGG